MDIDNTLLDFHACSRVALERVFNLHNLPFDDKTFPTFLEINDSLWLDIERGVIDKKGLFARRFKLVLKALNIDYPHEQVESDYRELLSQVAIPIDGAFDLLDYLSEKYHLYAASNAIYEIQIRRLTDSGLIKYFKDLFISEKMGAQKPTKEYFDACFNRLQGVKKEEVVMVGDSISADISGGKEYGLTTIWYDFKKTFSKCPLADYAVYSLEEIKGIL